jgi:NAD(P)-dependent dehydrogenase (short-subunit alcohol dehydrogenase family)
MIRFIAGGEKLSITSEDIANAVLFLASSEADNITAQEIVVDGGLIDLHPGFLVDVIA